MSRSRSPTGAADPAGVLQPGEPLSYESLRRIERGELRIPRLTKLEGGFWQRISRHLAELRAAFAAEQDRDPTSRKTVLLADELRNTERLASSIWEIREKKIVQEALAALRLKDRSRNEPPANMTSDEAELHRCLVEVLAEGRERTLPSPEGRTATASSVTRPVGAAPTGVSSPHSGRAPRSAEAAPDAPAPRRDAGGATGSGQPASAAGAVPSTGRVPPAPDDAVSLVLVRALEDIPQFAGPDLATYELAKDEVGTLPEQAARLLARRGKVTLLPAGTP